MRRWRLSSDRAALLMLGLGTLSLMGLPSLGGYRPPEGALAGIATDEDGVGVGDVPVGLFDGGSLALLEVTHTDEHGRFALQQAPETFHICVRPGPDRGLLPAWALDLERKPLFSVELKLSPAVPVDVLVTDDEGRPLEGADVRCYGVERARATVVDRRRTDAHGRARVLAAPETHLGAFGPSPTLLPSWRFALEIPDEGALETFVLPRGRRLHGRVRSEDGPVLRGIAVTAWDRRVDGWQWNGYRLTGEDGAFALYAGAGAAEVRALDRTLRHLPRRVAVGPTPTLELSLPRSAPLPVRCHDEEHDPLAARVWFYCAETGTWGWGAPTDRAGRLDAGVSPATAASGEVPRTVCQPLHRGRTEARPWAATLAEGTLHLTRPAP